MPRPLALTGPAARPAARPAALLAARLRATLAARLAAGAAVALLAGCSAADGGPAPAGDGALVEVQHDVDLGFAEPDAADDAATYLRLAVVAPDGTPLTITTRGDGTRPQLLRGLEATPSPALDVLGESGVVTGAAVAADGTLVVLAGRDGPGAVVLRVAPDDSVQELRTALAPDSVVNGVAAFSPGASRVVVARKAPGSDGRLFISGEVEVVTVDTTTGEVLAGPVLLPFTGQAQRSPGRAEAVEPRAVALADDGSAAIAVDSRPDGGGGRVAELLRLDPALAVVGERVPLPLTGERDARSLVLRPDGTAYVTALRPDPQGDDVTSYAWGGAFVLLRHDAGAVEADEVVAVPGRSIGIGLAVPGDGRWAYVGGSFAKGVSADFLPVDLGTGEAGEVGGAAAAVEVCDDGLVGDPVADPTGTHLVLSGTCDETEPRAAHVYVLGAAG